MSSCMRRLLLLLTSCCCRCLLLVLQLLGVLARRACAERSGGEVCCVCCAGEANAARGLRWLLLLLLAAAVLVLLACMIVVCVGWGGGGGLIGVRNGVQLCAERDGWQHTPQQMPTHHLEQAGSLSQRAPLHTNQSHSGDAYRCWMRQGRRLRASQGWARVETGRQRRRLLRACAPAAS